MTKTMEMSFVETETGENKAMGFLYFEKDGKISNMLFMIGDIIEAIMIINGSEVHIDAYSGKEVIMIERNDEDMRSMAFKDVPDYMKEAMAYMAPGLWGFSVAYECSDSKKIHDTQSVIMFEPSIISPEKIDLMFGSTNGAHFLYSCDGNIFIVRIYCGKDASRIRAAIAMSNPNGQGRERRKLQCRR